MEIQIQVWQSRTWLHTSTDVFLERAISVEFSDLETYELF